MPSKLRLKRIGERIQEELSEMLIFKISDPRLSGLFITGVDVDRELTFADVFVSAVEGASRSKEALEGLQHAAGFLRHELAAAVHLRIFPKLRFHWDSTPENADRIERILNTLREPTLTQDEKPGDEAGNGEDEADD